MISARQLYLKSYGLPVGLMSQVVEIIRYQSLIVFGASGGLGLSLLEIIKVYSLRPQEIVLYVRPQTNTSMWFDYCLANNISIRCVLLSGVITESDLSDINNHSCIFYLLGSAQPRIFMSEPKALFDINTILLSKVIDRNPRYLFYASTSEIYSGLTTLANEDSPTVSKPQDLRGCYIESKRCGEAILHHLSSQVSRFVSFRIALASPPHFLEDDKRVLADLVRKAKYGKVVSLSGGWNSVRQYQWGPVCLSKILWAGFMGKHSLYNISGGEIVTLEVLAKEVSYYFKVPYEDNRLKSFTNLGAPDHVLVSQDRLNRECGYLFPDEPIRELISVYAEPE